MERTISVMIGRGNVNHNRRHFITKNVDASRTIYNHEYVYIDIRDAYHFLFDEALQRYNSKQYRKDRVIDDYYEKIRLSKQEKSFHEIIIQIGNKDDMNVKSENGELAKNILDEYMKSFQERNPNLYVYSAHLHMDEETPHLHIDFIPFITNSKRGLDTRVSLKQALNNQGFKGGTRTNTEWNQWILSEKQYLAKIMKKYQIKWKQLGTHEQHLDILDFKKMKRNEEIISLKNEINDLTNQKQHLNHIISSTKEEINEIENRLTIIKEDEKLVNKLSSEVKNDKIWNIPKPSHMISSKTYHKNTVIPFIQNIKSYVNKIIKKCIDLTKQVKYLNQSTFKLKIQVNELNETIDKLIRENREIKNDLSAIRKALGHRQFQEILNQKKEREVNQNEKNNR